MGLTCLWRRRQLARHLLTSRPIDDDPGLKRHVERCSGCAKALRDFECFDSALRSEQALKVSPDFNSKLAARLSAVAPEPSNPQPSAKTGIGGMLGGPWPAVALACTGGLIVWICASRNRSESLDSSRHGDRTVWVKASPRHMPDSMFKRFRSIDPSRSVVDGLSRGLEPSQWLTQRRQHRRRYLASARNHKTSESHHNRKVEMGPAASESAGSAVGAKELFISLVTTPWGETADAYAQIGDEPNARDAYAKEFERDGNVEAAIRAGEYSAASGDPASELQYCALALSADR